MNEITHNDHKTHTVTNGTTIRRFHVDKENKSYESFTKDGDLYVPTIISFDKTYSIIYTVIPHDILIEAINFTTEA